ncbi:rhomboid-domain-containing protein [Rickenella mellea]|uniref:Rhomboid-domain-containing protein n=1 Tax=Rickenella mellea TaxID=50990 RepID=A0A4Y7Q8S3_9AGAM|nr:rhomboid-domain-containing protein [Rickenella mellea]
MAYAKAANFLLAGNDGRRMAMWIIAANVAVYILWKVPRFIPMMNANFTHHPLSGKAYTMLTCMFSHQSLIHLGFNCMVLASFAPAVVHHLTLAQTTYPNAELEATPQWHFVAFYVAAGLFASLASHVFTTRITYPRLISKLTAAATSRLKSGAKGNLLATANKSSSSTILPSLGASGAIYAMFTLTALSQPDVQIRLIIPPTPDFPISWGLYGMLIFDTLGILRGWRMMDHVAHLGGAAFGAWYYYYGQRVWAAFRHKIVRIEFKLRGIS